MTQIPARLFVELITIESYVGQGAYTDVYAAPVTVLGHIASARYTTGGVRVQSSITGDEVVADMRLMLPNPTRLADGSGTVDPSTLLTAESRITSGAITAKVMGVEEHRKPGEGRVVYVSGALG